jgi:hypothetical protein
MRLPTLAYSKQLLVLDILKILVDKPGGKVPAFLHLDHTQLMRLIASACLQESFGWHGAWRHHIRCDSNDSTTPDVKVLQ